MMQSLMDCAKEHEELKTVLQANGEFAKNLYSILANKPGNVFFSPISIHAILSLLYQGANGRTHEAFAQTLNLPDVRVAALGYKYIMSRLNSVKVTLLMANKVFLRENYELQETFKTVAVKKFSSKVKLLDFKQSQVTASSINTWIENKTNKKIKDIINPDDITDDTSLVLVNAIYFKGKWARCFNAQDTRTGKFFLNDGEVVDVQMMYRRKNFFYKADDTLNAQILELPYVNKTVSLVIVLPYQPNGIADLEQKLKSTDIMKLTENIHKQEVKVALPKFKIEQTIDLKDSLTELGLGVIFKRKDADFSGIVETANDLYVSKVIQKVFIEVTEEGTEAAAASGTEFRELCRPPNFTANHPFFIILRCGKFMTDNQEGSTTVLFAGRISKPQY